MKGPRFTLRGFRSAREAVQSTLGALEREVMEEIWRRGEMSVRQLHSAFDERAAYTTLMTTLNRLHKKGLLDRRKEARAFVYSPRVTRAEFDAAIARDIIGGLLGRDAEPVLACIVEAVSEREGNLLNELDRLVKDKRRTLARKG